MLLLVDMNLTPRWVPFLSDAGHGCLHWSEIGAATTADEIICSYARQHGYVLLTNDLDFRRFSRTRRTASLVSSCCAESR
jgi:predicted nuclease of predicted toxin-antitoxin system